MISELDEKYKDKNKVSYYVTKDGEESTLNSEIYTDRENKIISSDKTSDYGNLDYDECESESIKENINNKKKTRKEITNKENYRINKNKKIFLEVINISFIISIIAIILSFIPFVKKEINNPDSFLSDYLLSK
jgi:hypothetical protein